MVKQNYTAHLIQMHATKATAFVKSAGLILLACASLVSVAKTESVHAQTEMSAPNAAVKQVKKFALVKLSHAEKPAFSRSVLTLTKLNASAQKASQPIKRLIMPKAPAPAAPAVSSTAQADSSSVQTASSETTSQTLSTTQGLNMNQTTGYVNISVLANYMASLHTVSGFTAAEWAQVITGESGGQVDVWNQSGTPCYGVFQEWGVAQGTTLGQQIQIAAGKPASAWAATI